MDKLNLKLVIVFLISQNSGLVYGRLIDNVNKAIVANLYEDFSSKNITNELFLQKIDDDLLQLSEINNSLLKKSYVQQEQLEELRNTCTLSDNISACQEYLKEHCVNVHQLLQAEEISNITDWFPSLFYTLYSSACRVEDTEPAAEHLKQKLKVPSEQAWGYGLGFVALICCVSNIGGFMAPFMKKDFFQRILLFCVALAVGTLASTGLLVLIPESMHLTAEDSPVPDYHLKMATVMGGIYFFYISERLLKMWFSRKKKPTTIEKKVPKPSSFTVENGVEQHLTLDNILNIDNELTALPVNDNDDTEKSKFSRHGKRSNKLSTVALMIMIGDALHNFVDGIAIGAAFTENVYLGISVSISVVCEELPHELGDIAILLHSGLTMKKSLLVNFLAALTCFVGLVIGILLGENTDANMWIFAVAGGMFVYIALVDMFPEMAEQAKHVEEEGIENKWTAIFIQNIGLISGFVVIMMLVMYGGEIKVNN